MAEDEGRAARIAELKERHPRLTWARIAQEVGVSERAATRWQRTGALRPENAEALARLFGVDFDYIWTGPRPDTPDLFVDRRAKNHSPALAGELAGVLRELRDAVAELRTEITSIKADVQEQLNGQTQVLERIETRLDATESAKDEISQIIDQRRHEIVQGLPPASAPDPKPKPPRSRAAKTKARPRSASQRTA